MKIIFTPKPIAAPFMFDKTSNPTFLETMAIFKPIIDGINSLRGEVITWRGFPAFFDHQGEISRIDQALRGWIDCWKRLDDSLDASSMARLCTKLEYGMPIAEDDIDSVILTINRQIARFQVLPVDKIMHHALTEQIAIQMDALGIGRTTA